MKRYQSFLIILFFILLSALTATTGILFKPGTWYANLAKPLGTPPNIVFPIMWSVLYLLMAISASLVSFKENSIKTKALRFYYLQLAANFLWSYIVFEKHLLALGLIDMILMNFLVATCVWNFYKISKPATQLMGLYQVWALYAAYLNLGLLILN